MIRRKGKSGQAADNRRYAPRYAINLASSGAAQGSEFEGSILSVSHTGMSVNLPVQLAAGERLTLDGAGGESIAAVVIWNDGLTHGCRFESPLSAAMLSAIRLKSDPVLLEDEERRNEAEAAMAEPEIKRLPTRLRLVIAFGAALGVWAGVALLVRYALAG